MCREALQACAPAPMTAAIAPPSREVLDAAARAVGRIEAAQREWDLRSEEWTLAIRSGDPDRKDEARRCHDAAMHAVIRAYSLYFGHAEVIRYLVERRCAA